MHKGFNNEQQYLNSDKEDACADITLNTFSPFLRGVVPVNICDSVYGKKSNILRSINVSELSNKIST